MYTVVLGKECYFLAARRVCVLCAYFRRGEERGGQSLKAAGLMCNMID